MGAAPAARSAMVEADEIDELYRRDGARLLRLVRDGVRAPEPVIEDACQIAWGRLIDRRERVRRETVSSWLAVTAVHEACRMLRRADRDVSLDQVLDDLDALGGLESVVSPDETVDRRARLHALRLLPERQRRLLWLQGLGLSYAEMASETGATVRTVERQLLRARRRLREAASEGE